MAGVVHIGWYSTLFRKDSFAAEVAAAAPLALRYGATQYSVQISRDDRYKILQMAWFESKADWYRYWEGPEMNEFRRRNSGRFQTSRRSWAAHPTSSSSTSARPRSPRRCWPSSRSARS